MAMCNRYIRRYKIHVVAVWHGGSVRTFVATSLIISNRKLLFPFQALGIRSIGQKWNFTKRWRREMFLHGRQFSITFRERSNVLERKALKMVSNNSLVYKINVDMYS